MHWLDNVGEKISRHLAHRSSRRSVLSTLGKVMVASSAILPVLPVSRAAASTRTGLDIEEASREELESCDYWRYCAVDGFLCSCCGGTVNTCPPGSTPSPLSWVGTCHNPHDGKDYLISYNDCCGKTACSRCSCATHVRERPGYEFFLHNDVNWCMSNENSTFHCTTSVLIGLAKN